MTFRPPKRPTRSRKSFASAEAASAGAAWERTLAGVHGRYLEEGIGKICKRGAPCSIVGRGEGAAASVRIEGKGPSDYGGVLLQPSGYGIPVDFEAKSTKAARFSLSRIKDHQAVHLDQSCSMGSLCFVAVQFRSHEVCLVLPWAKLRARWHLWKREAAAAKAREAATPTGLASLTLADAQAMGARMHRPGDWYPALVALGLVDTREAG